MNTHYVQITETMIRSGTSEAIPDSSYIIHGQNENLFTTQTNSQVSVEDTSNEYAPKGMFIGTDDLHFDLWSLPFFVDFIIENHHHFVKKQLPFIAELIDYVNKEHSRTYPTLIEIQKLFLNFSDSFYKHIFRKEEELFTYIKKLHRLAEEGKQMTAPYFGSIIELENQISAKHNVVENDLSKLRQITNNFEPPDSACTNHKRIYKLLKALFFDIRQHICLENNLVFPEALELEKKVLVAGTVTSF